MLLFWWLTWTWGQALKHWLSWHLWLWRGAHRGSSSAAAGPGSPFSLSFFCHCIQLSFACSRSTPHALCVTVPVHRTDSMSVRSSPKNDSFCNTFFFLIENVRHWIERIPISVSQCPSKNKPLTIICSNDENGLKLKNLTFLIYEKQMMLVTHGICNYVW